MLVFLFLRGNVSLDSLPFSSPLSDLAQRTHSYELRILVAFRISPVAYLRCGLLFCFGVFLGRGLNVDLKCKLECLLLSPVSLQEAFVQLRSESSFKNEHFTIVKRMYEIFAIN